MALCARRLVPHTYVETPEVVQPEWDNDEMVSKIPQPSEECNESRGEKKP